MILIGYSGHAFVVCGILRSAGTVITGYCDRNEKNNNPFLLPYLGQELSEPALDAMRLHGFFISIGDNMLRSSISDQLAGKELFPSNAIHPLAIIDSSAELARQGVMVAAGAIINPLVKIGRGSICNTGCIIEHECRVGDFAHIGPGAVLCGNVEVGEKTFIGANAVVRQGIRIGSNAMIGAGAVVVKDVPDGVTVMGIPAKPCLP